MLLVVPALAVLYDIRLEPVVAPYSAMLGNLFMRDRTAMVMCTAAVAATTCVLMKLLIRVRAKR